MSRTAKIYTKPDCPYCVQAKDFLTGYGIEYKEQVVGKDVKWEDVQNKAPQDITTVPQIWISKSYVGGYDDLVEWAINE